MRSQIEGLANLIGNSYKNFNISINPLFRNLPVELIPASKFTYSNINEIKIQEKTILISCGKKSVKASILLKKRFKDLIFNIHIQDPKTKHNLFNLIICPEHDKLNKLNSISTLLALHNIKYNLIKRKKNTINFIIGGSNKYFKFKKDTQEKVLNEIIHLSKLYYINVIPSRRTPTSLIQILKKINSNKIKTFDDIFNPSKYGDLLSEGLFQIVTWDSISMISEAICSKANTFIFNFEDKNCPTRYQRFYKSIIDKNLAKFYTRDLKSFDISLDDYNEKLKTKILNKIKSHLWFKSYAP